MRQPCCLRNFGERDRSSAEELKIRSEASTEKLYNEDR